MKKTRPLLEQLYAAALRGGGVINTMQPQSRQVLREAQKRATTEADLQRMRAAHAKRERRAAKLRGDQ